MFTNNITCLLLSLNKKIYKKTPIVFENKMRYEIGKYSFKKKKIQVDICGFLVCTDLEPLVFTQHPLESHIERIFPHFLPYKL